MTKHPLLPGALAATLLALLHATPAAAAGKELKPGDTFLDCSHCPEMVVIPAGKATIGSTPEQRAKFDIPKFFADRESKQLDVTIAKPFAVSKFEITRGMYAEYVKEAGVRTEPGCAGFDAATQTWPMNPKWSWRDPGFKQGDDEPVVCMNYPDAQAFVAWLTKKSGHTYRLLSETEWEYAARGGATTIYPWGDNTDDICERANIYDIPTATTLGDKEGLADKVCAKPRKKEFTEPVGSYAPNGFGLYDMVGNVWEMLADCASDTYDGVPADGSVVVKADCKKRMPRGGGWNSRAWTARLATRGQGNPEYRAVALGLRVARDLP